MLDEYQARVWEPKPAEFLRRRGLSHSTVARFGLGYTGDDQFVGAQDVSDCLVIPYEDGLGRVRQLRYRPLHKTKQKYITISGEKGHIFAVRAADFSTVTICEGEIDAMSCWQSGVKAIAIPGANVWQDSWKWLLRNARRVVLALDPDDAGVGAARAMYASISDVAPVDVVHLPEFMDVNDVLVQKGEAAVRDLLGVV